MVAVAAWRDVNAGTTSSPGRKSLCVRPAVAGSLAGTLLARCQQPWAEVEGLTASLVGRYLAAYCQLTNDRQMEEQRAAVQALAAAPGQAAAVALCAMIRGLLGDA